MQITMDTSTDYFQVWALTIGELLEFWDVLVDVTETRREMQDKELEELREQYRRGV